MGLLVWVPFVNGNCNNQGLLNLTTSTLGTVAYENGKLGLAAKMGNGTQITNGIKIENTTLCQELGTEYSCSVWIKPMGNHVHYEGAIISSGDWNKKRWAFGVNQSNTGVDLFGPGHGRNVSCSIPTNEWTHLVSTFKNNVGTLYKNGQFVATYNFTNSSLDYNGLESDSTWTAIGRETYAAGYFSFNGYIQDVRIYDYCLSEQEIKKLSQGLILHLPLSRRGFGQDNLVQKSNMFRVGGHANKVTPSVLDNGIYQVVAESGNSNYSSSWWTTVAGIEDNFEEGETFTVSFTIRSSDGNGTNPPTIYIKPGMGYYSMTGKVTPYWSTVYYTGTWKKDGSVNPHLGWSSRVGTYQIKNWKIEKGSIPTSWIPNSSDTLYSQMGLDDNIHKDISGYQHNAILNNITYSTDTPYNDICSVFNGSNSYVKVNDNTWMVDKASELTVNFWAYSSNWASVTNGGRMMSCTEGGGFNLEGGSTGYIRFPRYVYTNAEQTSKSYQYSNTGIKLADLTAGWHMFTLVYNTSGEKIYIDGTLHSEASYTSYGLSFNKNARLYLGCEASGANPTTPYFNGRMSDFRIYYTALSADEVLDLYEKR